MIAWKVIVYATNIKEYKEVVNGIEYNFDNVVVRYINIIWLSPYHTKFIKLWTNHICHCNYYTTSCLEGLHSIIKG